MAKEYYSLAFEDIIEKEKLVERAEDALVSYMNQSGDQPFSIVYKDGMLIAFFSQEQ